MRPPRGSDPRGLSPRVVARTVRPGGDTSPPRGADDDGTPDASATLLRAVETARPTVLGVRPTGAGVSGSTSTPPLTNPPGITRRSAGTRRTIVTFGFRVVAEPYSLVARVPDGDGETGSLPKPRGVRATSNDGVSNRSSTVRRSELRRFRIGARPPDACAPPPAPCDRDAAAVFVDSEAALSTIAPSGCRAVDAGNCGRGASLGRSSSTAP